MLEGRDWLRVIGATSEELSHLRAAAPRGLPERYVDLLASSNGGEGPLRVNPFHLQLDAAAVVVETINSDNHGQADLQGFMIFGSNGGGEYLAFDTREVAPWPIVMIDMVAGVGSAEVVAPDFDSFYGLIGVEAEDA